MQAIDALLEVLRTEGVSHVFGNPGSTELPFMDGLAAASDIHYVLALQEATAVGMADGYAQATGRPAFLNLHTSAGLGNAIGNLTNAQANATPLVVTAGQQDRRHLIADPLLAGNLTELAAPVSKWAREVTRADDLPVLMRRAFHDAASAPAGPVFVSIPMDLLGDEVDDDAVVPPSTIDRRTIAGRLDELAALLAEPGPDGVAIVAADEVTASGATAAVVALAEALGCRVFGAPLHSSNVFPPSHGAWAGSLPAMSAGVRQALGTFRRVLLIGDRLLAYPYTPGPAVPPEVELLHLSADASRLGRALPTRLGLQGDPKATLEALLPLVRATADGTAAGTAAGTALARLAAERRSAIDGLETKARDRYDDLPMHPMAAAHALVRALPPETPVVDEAITTGTYVRGFHHTTEPNRYFFCRGGGLGWGMPAALGVSLGYDRSPVLCVVGDGSALYSPQALWTAAHENLPVVFAVVNNRQYLILKNFLRGMGGGQHGTVGLDLDQPPVDFVALAHSMGVPGQTVDKATDVGDAVTAALDAGGPHLLELPIAVA
ncbi:MAG: benzoylformate decarboxylase [Actinomycetota bacterium]|nr:benzoylformate decarboxylase [Actinomycetota bacterium]